MHAYVATGTRTRVHVSSFTLRVSSNAARRGESGPRLGVTKVASYFMSVRRITCRFVLSAITFPCNRNIEPSKTVVTNTYISLHASIALKRRTENASGFRAVFISSTRFDFVDACISRNVKVSDNVSTFHSRGAKRSLESGRQTQLSSGSLRTYVAILLSANNR